MSDAAKEFEAIQAVHSVLDPLSDEARTRVLVYITSLLQIDAGGVAGSAKSRVENDSDAAAEKDNGDETTTKQPPTFDNFAELYAAANPTSNGEKSLVAGYWLQVCNGATNFTGQEANKELTHLGHKLANITDAIDSMKNQKPQLMLQVKKSGSSRQSRKIYQVSHAGIERVQEMVGG